MGEILHKEEGIVLSRPREIFHKHVYKFREYFGGGETIHDIGVSERFNYAPVFEGCDYNTVDKKENTKPDLKVDLTKNSILKQADGIICMGVMEQIIDLQIFIDNLEFSLVPNGLALFGIRLTGMPVYVDEFTRFTLPGVEKLLKNFTVLEGEVLSIDKIPTFYFAIARKK